ncbi:MAG: hypothetical protein DRR42_23790 [Gammaproteobacteria bacterium]|nr:MAG: hypothetical protein DRQ44_09610 [Gammaproteobacteria bacterium]RLA42252.1 MAG: hypothetical protein DRR42_23790 [Gammaproteobacteria bacterium]
MKTVKIPENWTGKEAIAVYDFLADVMEAIWERHNEQMVEILCSEEDEPADQIDWLQQETGCDEIPF